MDIAVLDSTDARIGGCSGVHLANLPRIPAATFSVAIFLKNVLAIKVVHANLAIYLSGRVLEMGNPLTWLPSLQLTEASGVKGIASTMGWS